MPGPDDTFSAKMNNYYKLTISIAPYSEAVSDLIADSLADIGFESFVPEHGRLICYVPAELYDPASAREAACEAAMDAALDFDEEFIEGRDWNSEWELHYFQPIVIAGKLVIHSSFHTDIPEAEIDITIDPKMAFGTGHHATTSQVATALMNSDLRGKSLIDMGTGTGILAMLALKLGAARVDAVEIDAFAYENAVENCRLNGCADIRLYHSDASALEAISPADFFTANINRNIILRDMPLYVKNLNPGGKLILSGFYLEDVPAIEHKAGEFDLRITDLSHSDNWACVTLTKQ